MFLLAHLTRFQPALKQPKQVQPVTLAVPQPRPMADMSALVLQVNPALPFLIKETAAIKIVKRLVLRDLLRKHNSLRHKYYNQTSCTLKCGSGTRYLCTPKTCSDSGYYNRTNCTDYRGVNCPEKYGQMGTSCYSQGRIGQGTCDVDLRIEDVVNNVKRWV